MHREETALWIIDMQERLFPQIDRGEEILERVCFMLKAASILKLPLVVTEHYPQGLGKTLPQLRQLIPSQHPFLEKSCFSGYCDPAVRAHVETIEVRNWILVGIETHICLLQTAKDLIASGRHVVVLNDATSARSSYDYSTAIAELRDCNARISNAETVIYELVRDSKDPLFKHLLPLIKEYA